MTLGRYLDSMHTDKPLQIKSAMCTDVKGYIYVEAYKEVHVREATQGLNHLFHREVIQVPTQEMTDVMHIRMAEKAPLKKGAWSRVKTKGDYAGDLAQIVDLEADGSRAGCTGAAELCFLARMARLGRRKASGRLIEPPPAVVSSTLPPLMSRCSTFRSVCR